MSGPKPVKTNKEPALASGGEKKTGFLLARRDALGEIDVKVLFHFSDLKTQLGSVIAGRQQSLRIVTTILDTDVFGGRRSHS